VSALLLHGVGRRRSNTSASDVRGADRAVPSIVLLVRRWMVVGGDHVASVAVPMDGDRGRPRGPQRTRTTTRFSTGPGLARSDLLTHVLGGRNAALSSSFSAASPWPRPKRTPHTWSDARCAHLGDTIPVSQPSTVMLRCQSGGFTPHKIGSRKRRRPMLIHRPSVGKRASPEDRSDNNTKNITQ